MGITVPESEQRSQNRSGGRVERAAGLGMGLPRRFGAFGLLEPPAALESAGVRAVTRRRDESAGGVGIAWVGRGGEAEFGRPTRSRAREPEIRS